MTDKGYIYIRDNYLYKDDNVYKIGITTSITERSSTYITGELYRGFYIKIYEFNVNKRKLHLIDKLLKKDFEYLNIYFDGGTEFYDRCIINVIEDFFIKYNFNFISITEDELKKLNRNTDIINYKFIKLSKELIKKSSGNIETNKEVLRDYQIDAITFLTTELKLNNRCYLHLATGAGKSKIAINVISNIQPLNIFIFSPRINIKEQNEGNKQH